MTATSRRLPRRPWIACLGPQGEVDLDRAACPRAIVEDAVAFLGEGPVRWAMELSSIVVRQIVEEVPSLGGNPAAVEMLRRGNDVTTLRALFTLAGGSAAAPPADETILEGIREFVHRAVPLEQVLQGVRVGHAATTEALLRAGAELVDPAVAVDEVTAISGELFAYVDDISDAMIRTYLAEHEVWTTSAAAARADIVRSLLSDSAMTDAGEVSQALGYDLRRTHEALVAWSDSPNGSSTLQAAAIEALRARGATRTLVVPVASGRLWAWGAVPAHRTRQAVPWKTIAETLSQQQVQAAFGTPVAGVAGFRRSHLEAERAERIERLRCAAGRARRHATPYADVAVVALLAADLNAAGEFVHHELGGLAARDATMEALRTTLYHYIDAERSLVDVARRLHVARGTVTYRVKRAQEVLGYDVDDRRFALHAALALAEELGDAVLLPRDTRDEPDAPRPARIDPADQ